MKKLLIFIISSLFLCSCSVLSDNGISIAPTADLEKTVHWMVDDAIMAASTQLVYEMRKEIRTLIPATPTPTATYVPPVDFTPTMTSIWQGNLQSGQIEITATPQNCITRLKFVEDITIPDNTVVAAGKPFTKTWKLQNTGTCVWTDEYSFEFIDGDLMDANAVIPFPKDVMVLPNGTIDVSVYMTAPEKSGNYQGNWKIRTPWGTQFGTGDNGENSVWVKIAVR